ncbi:unnamed protein product [Parnassius apollo]|uniref:(apollo) hypothetical protein n=1 Tax=Parnassius apollo TaxID=110799 RepID=A0A8S3XSH7_PARAO|nr:unnamed protein product [Parnassius apollo]
MLISYLLVLWGNMIFYYPGIFLTCVSLYLTSIMDQFNAKIISTQGKMTKPSYWKSIREDYGCITNIIRSLDDLMGYLTLSTILNNIFFVCFQLYSIFSEPYQRNIYTVCSTLLMLLQLLTLVFFTSEVNTTSRAATAFLYKVTSTDFCTEVQRLIDQSHNDEVALSGLKFFYVTREFALSVSIL